MDLPTPADIGRNVIYKPKWSRNPPAAEHWRYGIITSFDNNRVFVRFGSEIMSNAIPPEDLEQV
jgi:hypothetical protein